MATSRSKLGKRSQRKGKNFEREVSERIASVPGWEAEHRIPQGRGGGKNNPDVRASCGDLHLHIECNHSKAPPVPSKWRQAVRDCGPHASPVVWIRYQGGREIVLVSWDWLIQVVPPMWVWPETGGNARAALDKANKAIWTGCTPVGAWTCDNRRIAVLSSSDCLHVLREIAIDLRSPAGHTV